MDVSMILNMMIEDDVVTLAGLELVSFADIASKNEAKSLLKYVLSIPDAATFIQKFVTARPPSQTTSYRKWVSEVHAFTLKLQKTVHAVCTAHNTTVKAGKRKQEGKKERKPRVLAVSLQSITKRLATMVTTPQQAENGSQFLSSA